MVELKGGVRVEAAAEAYVVQLEARIHVVEQ